MNYKDAKQEFTDLFGLTNNPLLQTYNYCLNTGTKPLSGFTVFKTFNGLNAFINGNLDEDDNEYFYETYSGALISVVEDSNPENNGTYRVIPTNNENPSTHENRYELVKLLSENDSVSGDVKVERKTSSDETNPYIYFVGVDSSTSPQDASTFYFNPGIVYDANGGMIVTESDIRLKDINTHLDVDVDSLVELDKVYFSWKDDPNHKQCIGVTAQSVEKRFPELVVNNPDTGYKMVNYAGLSVIALAAIDKLNEKYQILENRLNDLENKINNINR